MLTIKNLKQFPQYIDLLAKWHHNEWSYLNPQRPLRDRAKELETHLEIDSIPQTFIAFVDDKPVGCASVLESDMDTKPDLYPWLASVFVLPEFRHRGIGRKLVHQVMQHTKEAGSKNMYLYTPDRAHFYKNMGWKSMEEVKYHGENVTIMSYDF
jgi:N-acetylglutamate synthase-like GNAT family acetyltransferase